MKKDNPKRKNYQNASTAKEINNLTLAKEFNSPIAYIKSAPVDPWNIKLSEEKQ